MTRVNQRGLERFKLDRQPAGRLTLRSGAAHFAIDEINDISETGISFTLDHSEAVSSKVAIEYADSEIKFEVYGRVAWCAQRSALENQAASAPAGAEVYVLGVELLTTTMLFAMLKTH
jgi:hypothetical protein